MEHILPFLHTVLSFFIVISVIVFIHEFGHYFIAKLCGVKVEVFSIGFGKELVGWTDRSGTRWKIAPLPIGGYVKMFGDSGAASTPDNNALEEMSAEDKQKSFHFKPLWKKASIVAAGPLANFILTISILTYFIFTVGLATTEPVVGEIMPGTPAEAAGLKAGDRIISVGGEKVETFGDIPTLIATNLGTPVTLVLIRDGKQREVDITPQKYEDDDALGNKITRPLIGFRSMQMKYEDVGFAAAIWEATKRTYIICETTLHAVGQIVRGERSATELKGPLGIAKMSGQASEKGITTILWFVAMLSANLGLVNLFPIPMLDGGHLLFYAVESLRGKPLALKIQEYSFRMGFVLLMGLMIFTVVNDFRQLL